MGNDWQIYTFKALGHFILLIVLTDKEVVTDAAVSSFMTQGDVIKHHQPISLLLNVTSKTKARAFPLKGKY